MDNALSALLSWQFLLFALGMFAITWFIRTVVEYIFPKIIGATLWEKLVLPAMPSIFGGIIAYFAKAYPYPDGLVSTSARLMFGCVAGMFSGLVYQVVKGMLKDRIQAYISNAGSNVPVVSPVVPAPAPTSPQNLMGGPGNKQP